MKKLAILCTVILVLLLPAALVVGCQQPAPPEEVPPPEVAPPKEEGVPEEVAPPPPIEETLTYTNSEYGVSFDYPTDWIEVEISDPEALWIVAFQESGYGIESGVAVAAYDMEGITLREFEQAMPWVFTNVNYTMPIVEVTINGRDAIRYSWAAESDGSPVKGDDIYITKDYEVVYWIECYSLTSEYFASEDAFNMLLDSFNIE